MSIDPKDLVGQRRNRLNQVLEAMGLLALLTCDPFSIRYATGTRNMLVHGLTGPDRLALIMLDGPTILWEFAGCDHLTADASFVDDLREAPGLTAKKTLDHEREIARFAAEATETYHRHAGRTGTLAIERIDPQWPMPCGQEACFSATVMLRCRPRCPSSSRPRSKP